MSEHTHSYDFSDRNHTVIACPCGQKQVLKPISRNLTLAQLQRQGEWAGEPIAIEAKTLLDNPPRNPQGTAEDPAVASVGPPAQVPAVHHTTPVQMPPTDLVEYETPDGQQVALSVQIFRQMICPQANPDQARYMMGWCAHNRIDPWANEAYFSIGKEREKDKDGNPTGNWLEKPVIQVSKDCWLRRMERHPQLSHYDSGLTINIGAKRLQSAILGGMGDDYLIAPELRTLLIQALVDGKLSIPGGLEGRLIVRKRGQYLAPDESLEGSWCKIWRHDRPEPTLFEINCLGWAKDNVFWKNMGPFMLWKTAVKNCTRQVFPELAALIAQREAPEGIDSSAVADAEFTTRCTTEQLRALHGAGSKVPPPVGPLRHGQLHDLAVLNYEGRGLAELTIFEMAQFQEIIEKAVVGDTATLMAIENDLKQENTDNGSTQDPDGQSINETDSALLF